MLPSGLGGKAAKGGELAAGPGVNASSSCKLAAAKKTEQQLVNSNTARANALQADDAQGLGDHHALLLVEGRGDTLEHLTGVAALHKREIALTTQ